jgi:hypothetical protein
MEIVKKIARLVKQQEELMIALDDLKAHVNHLQPGMESGEMEPFVVKFETRWTNSVSVGDKHQPEVGFALFQAAAAIIQNNLFAVNRQLATMELVLEADAKEGTEPSLHDEV